MTVAEAVTLIAALTAAITAFGTIAIQWRNSAQLDKVHALVNGQSLRMETLAGAAGFSEGKASGGTPAEPPQAPTAPGLTP